MRRLLVRFTAVGMLAGALSMLGLGAAHAVVTCDNTYATRINGATINDNVIVPSGRFCYINNSTIAGSISVQPGANLDVHDSSIGGGITASSPYGFGLTNTSVRGPVNVNGTTPGGGYFICGSSLSSLTISNSAAGGNYWEIGQYNICPRNTFTGTVQFNNNANRVVFQGNQVSASVIAQGNTGTGLVDGNTINGSLYFNNNNPCWQGSNTVHGATSVPPCA